MKIERRKNVQFNEFHGITLDWKVIRLNKIKHLINIVETLFLRDCNSAKSCFHIKIPEFTKLEWDLIYLQHY